MSESLGEKCSAQLKAPAAKPRQPCGGRREDDSSGGTHVNDGLLRLSHVRYDAVGDDEQDEVLGAVLDRRRVPADREQRRHLGTGHMIHGGLNQASHACGRYAHVLHSHRSHQRQ